MKLVRADLMAEGRSDIATKVRAYRGGYSQEVRISTSSIMSISQLKHHHRIVARSSRKRFRAAYLVSWLQMRSSWVLISVHVCSLIVLFFYFGVSHGSLHTVDAVISLGFPFSVASFVRITELSLGSPGADENITEATIWPSWPAISRLPLRSRVGLSPR